MSVYTLLKVVSYYDLSVLSMSVMVSKKKKFGWGVGGWGELYPSFFWDFWNLFNFAKPLRQVNDVYFGSEITLRVVAYTIC